MSSNINHAMPKAEGGHASSDYETSDIQAIEERLRAEQHILIEEMEQRILSQLSKPSKQSKSAHETLRSCAKNDNELPSEDSEFFSMPSDVFSMMCLSRIKSWSFVYAASISLIKIFFYTVILWEIFYKSAVFPKDIPLVVKLTQLVMLPITVIVNDEGILAALFIYCHLVYNDETIEQHHLLTRVRYIGFNLARFTDAILYQIVVFFVLMQAQEVLDIFLNFAALRFLMEIDKVPFVVAANGYLTEELHNTTKEVELIKLQGKVNDFRRHTTKVFFAFSLITMIVAWTLVQVVLG